MPRASLRWRWATVVLLAASSSACTQLIPEVVPGRAIVSAAPSELAWTECQLVADEYGPEFLVRAAYNTDVAGLRSLRAGIEDPEQPFAGEDEAQRAAILCWIDGRIPKGPPPSESRNDPFDRIAVGVLDGRHQLIVAGYQTQLEIVDP
jgi:hypothetical protein